MASHKTLLLSPASWSRAGFLFSHAFVCVAPCCMCTISALYVSILCIYPCLELRALLSQCVCVKLMTLFHKAVLVVAGRCQQSWWEPDPEHNSSRHKWFSGGSSDHRLLRNCCVHRSCHSSQQPERLRQYHSWYKRRHADCHSECRHHLCFSCNSHS